MADGTRKTERVTLRTIAEETGLSLSAVSLALRGGTSLRPQTRDRIAEAASRLGYVPDRAGVRLRTGKTNVIALVLDGAEDSIDFSRQMIQGIGQAIRPTRYHLTVIPEFERKVSTETVAYILDNRAADGVIITHTGPEDARVRLLQEADFPFVSHGRTAFPFSHAYHDFHAEAFVKLAVDRLASKGCRRMALVTGDDSTTNYRNLVEAFASRTQDHGIEGHVVAGDQIALLGALASKEPDGPLGVICDSEMRTAGLLGRLAAQGIHPNAGLQLIYKQTSGLLPVLFPAVDSIREDLLAAGAELTRLLIRRIDGGEPEDLQTLGAPVPEWRSE
jgi:LacI family transcriptional regulator